MKIIGVSNRHHPATQGGTDAGWVPSEMDVQAVSAGRRTGRGLTFH
jgi:hypothetical protein